MRNKIFDLFIKTNASNDEEMEICRYGLSILIKKIIHVFTILAIGIVGGEFWGVLVFLIVYTSVREYSGGYHAKSEVGCYFCTVIVMIGVLALLKLFCGLDIITLWIFLLLCGCVIWVLSPQAAQSKPLDVFEMEAYRKRTHKYLFWFGCISLLGFFNSVIIKGVLCAWAIQAAMLFIGQTEKGSQ